MKCEATEGFYDPRNPKCCDIFTHVFREFSHSNLFPTVCFHFDCQHNEGARNQGCLVVMEPNERNIYASCAGVCVCVMLACREFSIYPPPSSISFPSSLHGRVWMRDVEYGNSGTIQLNIPTNACASRNKKERNKRTKRSGYTSAEFAYIFYESIRNIKSSPNTHLIKFRLVGGTIEIISNEKAESIHSSVSSAHDRAGRL